MIQGEGYADMARRAKEKTCRKEWLHHYSGTNQIMTEEQKQQASVKPFDPLYEQHLAQLSRRNKLIRELQSKDEEQIELERLEQGFTIYVNGANAGIRRERVVTKPNVQLKPKTAESQSLINDLDTFRNSSAPERGRRKQWSQKSLTLKTTDGDIFTRAAHDYSDDFDMSADSLDAESRDVDEDVEEVHDCMRRLGLGKDNDVEDDEVRGSRLLLNIDDVKELRRSLRKSVDIRASFRFNSDTKMTFEFSPISSLAVTDDEDDVNLSMDVEQTGENITPWQPGDMIVLEFAPKVTRKLKDLSSARNVINSWAEVAESLPVMSSVIDQSNPFKSSIPVQSEFSSSPTVQSKPATSKSLDQMDASLKPALVQEVVEQVLQMQPEQQVKFWDMIQGLDVSFGDENPLEADEKPVNNDRFTPDSVYQLSIHLLSNWGHESLIGLTEIQLYDKNNEKICLKPENLSIENGNQTNLVNLFNGKYKTTKDGNMWSTTYRQNLPIIIAIDLSKLNGEETLVRKVKIWNYNKNLNYLTIGVKDFKICQGCRVLYEGQIEKGCANPVFEYGNLFELNYKSTRLSLAFAVEVKNHLNDQKGERDLRKSEGNSVLEKSSRKFTSRNKCINSIDLSALRREKMEDRVIRSSDLTRSRRSRNEETPVRNSVSAPSMENLNGELLADDRAPPRKGEKTPRSRSKRRMMANFTNPESTDNDVIRSRAGDVIKSLTDDVTSRDDDISDIFGLNDDSLLGQLRTVRKEQRKSVDKVNTSDDVETLRDWPSRGLDELPAEFSNTKPRRVQSGRRAGKVETLGGSSGKPETVNVSGNETVNSSGKSGIFNTKFIAKDELELLESKDIFSEFPAKNELSARAQWRQNYERSLEDSWTSLSLFNTNHRGRLSTAIEDDVMDEYLHPEKKPKPCVPMPVELDQPKPVESEIESEFTIPELPRGQELQIDIRTTWGDRHYVGLTGIEIFSEKGPRPTVVRISANPADINILPEYSNDPRVVSNLLDGVNQTKDDTHMWLTPYTSGGAHIITISFDKPYTLAILRFWNYNKSRIHSYRGAKDVVVKLDSRVIFDGEISRASGGVFKGMDNNFGETILFTMDEEILEKVSAHDDIFDAEVDTSGDENESEDERPKTADESDERPLTHAARNVKPKDGNPKSSIDFHIAEIMGSQNWDSQCEDVSQTASDNVNFGVEEEEVQVYRGQVLKLNFTQTWGDLHYLGLTGLSLVGVDGDIQITRDQIEADPADLTSLPGCQNDLRTLDKLIDGVNITIHDNHMWLVPFVPGQDHVITVTSSEVRDLIGVRIWNYNKNADDTYRGAKIVHVTLDDRQISPPGGYLIRRGPGDCFFDFAQEILFAPTDPISEVTRCKSALLPCGFIYQFHLINTWGDHFYIGLNGLEVYDQHGRQMALNENNIAAYPDSVNVLEGMGRDLRTPDKLINGINSTTDGHNMWLAPVIPSIINRIFIIFDKPTTVSMIKLWNYSKTPIRGVRDLCLYVDDLLVYNGSLDMCAGVSRGILPGMSVDQPYHTVLFSQDDQIVEQEKHTVIKSRVMDQDVQMTNDREIVTHYAREGSAGYKSVDQSLRPVTAVPEPVKRQR